MKMLSIVKTIAFGAALVALPLASAAAQSSMKECAAEWQKLKSAKQTAGKTYKEFSKECMSGKTTAAPAAPAAAPAATPPKPEAKTATKPSGGREAMIARERACAADWKADKAANKIPAGQKWPQYWSQCNKRKKAAGM
jgi:hypothetical protein